MTFPVPSVSGATRSWMRVLLLGFLCLSGLLSSAADISAPGTNRFLFIVDTSATMKGWDERASDSLFDFIYSGVRGAMTNGDTYGIWLAGGSNDTSAGVETWQSKFAIELASRSALRIREHGVKGKPALERALRSAAEVARNVGDLTVIVISNGESRFAGTPFDSEINFHTAKILPEMRGAKTTVNTVLIARDGEIIGWAVNSPDFLVVLPQIAERPKPSLVAPQKAPVAIEPVASAVPVPAVKLAVPPPAAPRVASNPIIITRESVDRDKQRVRALATTDGTTPIATVTNTPAAEVKSNAALLTISTTASPVIVAATNGSNAVAAAPLVTNSIISTSRVAPPVSNVQAPRTNSSIAGTSQSDTNVASLPVSKPSTSEPATIPGTKGSRLGTVIWAALGGVLLVGMILGIASFLRSREPQMSLVSRAAMMERVQR